MGEWSDYFEDFPEEDPCNYINGQFNKELAQQRRSLLNSVSSTPSEKERRLRKEQQDLLFKHKGIK
ncbi:hypothetical protein [Acinetobacter baumannii]|uniref:hypothetical protein n=1 Tax=Acinetobacter baumannii TaxID=470 RepID=UPI00081084BC|nr:hypothetical protein [Acinetobacter baumannii]